MAGKKIRVTWQDERYGGEKNVMAGSWWMELLFRHFCPWRWAIIDRALRPVAFLTSRLCRNSDLGIGFYCKKSAMRVRHCFSRASPTSFALHTRRCTTTTTRERACLPIIHPPYPPLFHTDHSLESIPLIIYYYYYPTITFLSIQP